MAVRNTRFRTVCPLCGANVAIKQNKTLYPHQRADQPGDRCSLSNLEPDLEKLYQQDGLDRTKLQAAIGEIGAAWRQSLDNFAGTGLSGSVGSRVANPLEQALTDWWLAIAEAEVEATVAKAVEYGATDLRDLGYQILDMAGRRPTVEYSRQWEGLASRIGKEFEDLDAYATEVGIAFYAAGKLARIIAAIKEGRTPSYDSWHDLGIYARMAQRVKQAGGWPFGPDGRED
jgi:hypothetical protein